MTVTEGLSYPLIFLHDCAHSLALAAGAELVLNPQHYLQPAALARLAEVCRLATLATSEELTLQLSFTVRLLWQAGFLERRESALHCASQTTALWLQQAPVTQLLTLRDAWWFRLMPERRNLPALAFPDYLARHWRRIIWMTCTWISQQPTDRPVTVKSLYAALDAHHLTTPSGNQANLPSVQRDVEQRVRSLATFVLRVALPSLGLVRVAGAADTAHCYPTEEGQAWLRVALRIAGKRDGTDVARAVALHVPGDGPILTAPGYPALRVDDQLRLRVFAGAPPALSFALLHIAELVQVPAHAAPEVPVSYRITRDSLARGVAQGYAVAEVCFMLGRCSGGELPPAALDRVRAWGREIQTVVCDPGYRLRLHPAQRRQLFRRRAFRERVAPFAAQDAVWVAQEQAGVLFRYLRRRGFTLTEIPASPADSVPLPATPRAALPLQALWVMLRTYDDLRRYLPALAQLDMATLLRDLERALPDEDKAVVERLLASQHTVLAQALGDDDARSGSVTVADEQLDSVRAMFQATVDAGQTVEITYVDTHGRTTYRHIRPLRLEEHDGREILVAHCELRDAERHFRLDRIVDWRAVG
jgi:hypothetical protein